MEFDAPKAYLYTAPDGTQTAFRPEDITIVHNDPNDWKIEAEGPYIPKGFRTNEKLPAIPDLTEKELVDMSLLDLKKLERERKEKLYMVEKMVSEGIVPNPLDPIPMPTPEGFVLHVKSEEEMVRIRQVLMDHYCGFVSREYVQEFVFPFMGEDLSYDQKDANLSVMIKQNTPQPAVPLKPEVEKVNHPPHYNQYKGLEIIDLVEQMGFNLGNAVKYISRAGFKDEDIEIQDLEKAMWYVTREITRISVNSLETEKVGFTVTFRKLCEQMNFNRGNAVLHICKIGNRQPEFDLEDLNQALDYLLTEIKRLKSYEEEN
jgi:uncharacterized protein DUF3310